MKYFLTGATGFVGNALTRQLRAAGHKVHASVRSPEKARELEALGVKLFSGDVTDVSEGWVETVKQEMKLPGM